MVERVKVNLNGREVEAILVTRIYTTKRKRVSGGKYYEWVDRHITVYIPSDMVGKGYLVVPLK